MNPSKSITKYILGAVIVVIVIVGGYFVFKGTLAGGGASVYKTDISETQKNSRTSGTISTGIPLQPGTPAPKTCKPWSKPWIQIISPNGGETYAGGQEMTITWKSCNIPQSSQVVVLLESSVGVFPYLTSNTNIPSILSLNDGIETFVIPTSNYSGLTTGLYKARVTTTPGLLEYSDNFFTINQ